MVVDCILDRKEGGLYSPKQFYCRMIDYKNDRIAAAMDCGSEDDVKRELCDYIDRNKYNPKIKDYINSVNWLEEKNFVVSYCMPVTKISHKIEFDSYKEASEFAKSASEAGCLHVCLAYDMDDYFKEVEMVG